MNIFYFLFFSDVTVCIGVDEILKEMRLLKAMLLPIQTGVKAEQKPVDVDDAKRNVAVVTNKTEIAENDDKHIPVWDIIDSDFESFPGLPDMTTEPLAKLNVNVTLNEKFENFLQEHLGVFIFAVAMGTVVIALVLGLLCSLCFGKKTGKKIVTENPPLDPSSASGTPLQSVTDVSAEPKADDKSSMSSISLTEFMDKAEELPKPVLETLLNEPPVPVVRVRYVGGAEKYKITTV